jgi:hypothetical protein
MRSVPMPMTIAACYAHRAATRLLGSLKPEGTGQGLLSLVSTYAPCTVNSTPTRF